MRNKGNPFEPISFNKTERDGERVKQKQREQRRIKEEGHMHHFLPGFAGPQDSVWCRTWN